RPCRFGRASSRGNPRLSRVGGARTTRSRSTQQFWNPSCARGRFRGRHRPVRGCIKGRSRTRFCAAQSRGRAQRGATLNRMRIPSIGVYLRLAAAVLCLFAVALGQESLKQIETRAVELKARGDAAGSLAEWEKAAAIDPKSARIQHEIGFLLAVLQRQPEA